MLIVNHGDSGLQLVPEEIAMMWILRIDVEQGMIKHDKYVEIWDIPLEIIPFEIIPLEIHPKGSDFTIVLWSDFTIVL